MRQIKHIAGGATGAFLDDRFNYEVYGIYGVTKEHQVGTGQYNSLNITQALNAYRDPASGTIVCADPVARAAGCVPANIFGVNALAPAAPYLAALITRTPR